LLLSDFDFSLCGYIAVKLLGFVGYCYGQLFFVAIDFKVVWYTPRVPACARSAKGHYALGDDFTVSSCYHYLRIQGLVCFKGMNRAVPVFEPFIYFDGCVK
jgi:hypothetical protein